MDKKEYSDYLNSEKWFDLCEEAYEKYEKTCDLCGSKYELEVHHRYYMENPDDTTVDDLRILCHRCHQLQSGNNLLPEGKYSFTISRCINRDTDTLLILDLVDDERKYYGSICEKFNYTNLHWKIDKLCNAIPGDFGIPFDLEILVGEKGRCYVTINKHKGKSYNNISRWFTAN